MATLERIAAASDVPLVQLAGILDQAGVRTIERAFLDAVSDALKASATLRRTPDPAGATPSATATRPLLIADVTGVSALSTSGISILLGAHRTLEQAGGHFILVGTSGHCSDVLRRCRLDTVFSTATDVSAALVAVRR